MRLRYLPVAALGLAAGLAGSAAIDAFDAGFRLELARHSAMPDSGFGSGFILRADQVDTGTFRAEMIEPLACPDANAGANARNNDPTKGGRASCV